MAKTEKLLTPIGECKWAHVQEPKPGFSDKDEPKYCINVVFDPKDKAWMKWAEDMKEQAEEAGGGNPVKWEKIKDPKDESKKVKTGLLTVQFHTGAKFKPGLFDANGVPLADGVLVGNGSKVRVNYSPKEYTGFGGGITLYLNAVQVLELVEFGENKAVDYGFDFDPEAVKAAEAEVNPFADAPESGSVDDINAQLDADAIDDDPDAF